MKYRQLPVNLVSSLGRSLQILLNEQFSESFLNKILRLLMNTSSAVTRNRAWPSDTAIYTYRVSLFSDNYKKDFNEFNKDLQTGLKENIFLIKVMLKYDKPSGKTNRLSFDQEMIFRMLESVLYYLNNGIQLFYADTQTPAPEEKTGEALMNLITGVVHSVNPSALIITRELQFRSDSYLLNELNKYIF